MTSLRCAVRTLYALLYGELRFVSTQRCVDDTMGLLNPRTGAIFQHYECGQPANGRIDQVGHKWAHLNAAVIAKCYTLPERSQLAVSIVCKRTIG